MQYDLFARFLCRYRATIVLADSIKVKNVKQLHSNDMLEFQIIPQGTKINVPSQLHDGIDLILVIERGNE